MTKTPEPAVLPLAAPGPEECREQLNRILGTPGFEAGRGRRFLAYVVEESLAGRAERIKAYSIALEVFGRDPSFDPQSDPIVRVEAGHLRRAIDRYYLTTGQADPVVIRIPKGGYAPAFNFRLSEAGDKTREEPESETGRPRRLSVVGWCRTGWALGLALAAGVGVGAAALTIWQLPAAPANPATPRLLVKPFEDLTGTGASTSLALGLTQEVISHMAKFKEIVIVDASAGSTPDARANALEPRYALAGTVEVDNDSVRLQARLISEPDGAVVWAESYRGDLKAEGLIELEAGIARQVATTLAQPYGVVFQADASKQVERPLDDWKAYSCTLAYYAYRATLDETNYWPVRRCLEEAVERFPRYATAWALLSQAYADGFRFHFDDDAGPAALELATSAARRALELDPLNVRGLQSKMLALYLEGDLHGAMRVGEQALAINPNDTEFMGEYGYRLAMSGNWADGCRLVELARERNPGPLAYYETALALCAYMSGDYRRAAMWIEATGVQENPTYHLIAAVVFAEAGQAAKAASERDWLLANAPNLAMNVRREFAPRVGRKADLERFISSLRKAGVPISD